MRRYYAGVESKLITMYTCIWLISFAHQTQSFPRQHASQLYRYPEGPLTFI